jgi:transcriptional regulator with XRE-family HTH domain
MRLDDYHRARLEQDAEYRAAIAEVSPTQDFADEIIAARIRLGLTQTRFARLAGMSQGRISKIESGLENLTIETMDRLRTTIAEADATRVGTWTRFEKVLLGDASLPPLATLPPVTTLSFALDVADDAELLDSWNAVVSPAPCPVPARVDDVFERAA